jgi:hypothetical protein
VPAPSEVRDCFCATSRYLSLINLLRRRARRRHALLTGGARGDDVTDLRHRAQRSPACLAIECIFAIGTNAYLELETRSNQRLPRVELSRAYLKLPDLLDGDQVVVP